MESALVRKAAILKDAIKTSWTVAKTAISKPHDRECLKDVHTHLHASRPHAALRTFQDATKTSRPEAVEDGIRLFGLYNTPAVMLEAFKSYIAAGFRPSSKTWTSLLRSSPVDIEELEQLAQIGQPSLVSEELVAALMRLYSKTGRPDLCEAIFERYEKSLEGTGRHPGPLLWKCLIDARGYLGDLEGAKQWFDAWRTSPAHPYGYMEQDQACTRPATFPKQLPTQLLLRAFGPIQQVLRKDFNYVAKPASTMVDFPAPDPRPYASFLRHIIDHTGGNTASLSFLELMAADRVPLTRSVLNTLIYHEAMSKEPSAPASSLAVYHKMKTSPLLKHRPNHKTFSMLFENAYREPVRDVSRSQKIAGPTKLQQHSGLSAPPFRYLSDPRALFADLGEAIRAGTAEEPFLLDSSLLDSALSAFVRKRDFVGAAAALGAYGQYRIEPTSATHAAVISGVNRAHKLGQAFTTLHGRAWYTKAKASELQERKESLNDLSGFGKAFETHTIDVQPVPSAHGEPSQYLVSRPRSRQREPRVWNGRTIPRRDWEIRATKAFEMRDTSSLKELLHMASRYAGDAPDVWHRRVTAAAAEMQTQYR